MSEQVYIIRTQRGNCPIQAIAGWTSDHGLDQ